MPDDRVDLQQHRALYALERVKAWKSPQGSVQLVKGLPVAVRNLGLAQEVAVLARRGGAASDLAEDLCGWLLAKSPVLPLGRSRPDPLSLVERIVVSSPQAVRAAEEEAIRFLEVLKLLGELVHG